MPECDVMYADSPRVYLFIRGPAAGHQHYVEPSQASDWDEKQTSHTHYSHSERRGSRAL